MMSDWMRTTMRTWGAFAAVNLFALVGMLVVVSGHTGGWIGAIFGVAFVLLLPGYIVTAALLGPRLQMAERIALSIAMSFAIVIAGGFILNALPGGLQARSWAIFIWVVVCAGSALLLARSLRRGASPSLGAVRIPRPRRRDVGLVIASLLVLALATGVAVHSAQGAQSTGYTQLWILPSSTGTTGATATTPIPTAKVDLGVRSEESTPQSYQLILQVNGARAQTYVIQLQPGQQWRRSVTIALGHGQGDVTVVATLYRPTISAQPYRQVRLTLT